jgi:hypothetical protein
MPAAVGHRDFIAIADWGCDRKHRRARACARLFQISRYRAFQAGEIIIIDDFDAFRPPIGPGECKPRMGAADIGEKNGDHSYGPPAHQYERGKPSTCSAR